MSKAKLLRGLLGCMALLVFAGCPPSPPTPPTPPPPTDSDADGIPDTDDRCPLHPGPAESEGCPPVPAKGQPVLLQLLLRAPVPPRLVRGASAPQTPFVPNGATQCCLGLETQAQGLRRPMVLRVQGVPVNSRWPSISREAIDFFNAASGANFFAIRVAPYLGDADHEAEWADIGGPVLPGRWPEFNQPWWDENRKFIWHAGSVYAANVEVQWDAWYGKTCKQGSQPCAWPAQEIQAWGERFTAGHARFIDKIVEEFGCFGNVTFKVDNEGANVPGARREYYEQVMVAIRDAERRVGCGIVHMIGTNWPEIGNGPFDYVTTHADAPLTTPFFGKHSANDEHNRPVSPEEDHSRFCQAQAKGLHYWYWRAEHTEAEMNRSLRLRQEGCGPASECFAPPPEDPSWIEPPDPPSPELRAAVESAKVAVGERCGTDHAGSLRTLGLLAAEMRGRGYCAYGPWVDALAVSIGERVHEFHSVRFSDGCWSQDQAQNPKFTWRYRVALPQPLGCDIAVPAVDEISCVLDQATGDVADCMPKANGQPILPAGDPRRRACELKAMGGADPTYRLEPGGSGLQLAARANPLQFQVRGTGSATVRCTVPATSRTLCNLPVSR